MNSRSRTHRSSHHRNSSSAYPNNSLSAYPDNQGSNSTYGMPSMSRQERGYGQRYFDNGLQDPSRSHRRYSSAYVTEDGGRREHRHRRHHTNVEDLANGFAGLNMGNDHSRHSRNASGRHAHRRDPVMPEAPMPSRRPSRMPPLMTPGQEAEFYLNRAVRGESTPSNNYSDGFRHLQRERSRFHTERSSRPYDPRDYGWLDPRSGGGSTRHHGQSNNFRDRMNRWF